MLRRERRWILLLALAAAPLLPGCDGAADDDSADDDDDYVGPTDENINLNVYGTVDGEDYSLLSMFSGSDHVVSCGAVGEGETGTFELVTADDVAAEMGRLEIRAEGFMMDTEIYAEQSLDPDEDGGSYQVAIPEKLDDPFVWEAGATSTCYIFIRTGVDGCGDPAIPYCGNFTCGTEEEPLSNAAGDAGRFTGTFNCYD